MYYNICKFVYLKIPIVVSFVSFSIPHDIIQRVAILYLQYVAINEFDIALILCEYGFKVRLTATMALEILYIAMFYNCECFCDNKVQLS